MILHGYIKHSLWKPLVVLRRLFWSWTTNLGAGPIVSATTLQVEAMKLAKFQQMMNEIHPANRRNPLTNLQMRAARERLQKHIRDRAVMNAKNELCRTLQYWERARNQKPSRNNLTDTRA